MTLRELIEQSPAGTLFSREGLLQTMQELGDTPDPTYVSTLQATRLLGYSTQWWRARCAAGEIEGAFQDEGERWRFPTAAARAYLTRRQYTKSATRSKRRARGPNRKEVPPPSSQQARSEDRAARPLVFGRPAPVGG